MLGQNNKKDCQERACTRGAQHFLVVCGFVLMPLAAVALLACVVYIFRIVEPLPYGPAISAAASAVAMYIILRLFKALFMCL